VFTISGVPPCLSKQTTRFAVNQCVPQLCTAKLWQSIRGMKATRGQSGPNQDQPEVFSDASVNPRVCLAGDCTRCIFAFVWRSTGCVFPRAPLSDK
jgi:hypothetical protein